MPSSVRHLRTGTGWVQLHGPFSLSPSCYKRCTRVALRALRRELALASAAVTFAVAFGALAAERAESIRLEYTAAAGCPDRASFEERALARSVRVRFVDTGETRTFRVTLSSGRSPVGYLVVRGARGGVEGVREIGAETCDGLADALAFAVALAVETSGSAPAAGSAPASTPVPASAPAPAPEPALEPAFLPANVRVLAPMPGRVPHMLYLGVDAAIASGVLPRGLVGVAPYLGWRANRDGWIQPDVRLAFLRAGEDANTLAGFAAFTWTVGHADLCLLSLPPDALAPARLLACARVEAGELDVGVAVPPTATAAGPSPWFAAGPLVRAEWAVVAPLFLEVNVAAMVRATANRFYVAPSATAYEVPYVGLEGEAGLGVHFL